METITDIQAGKAGTYLVCADLIVKGYIAYPSEEALSYDVVADVKGRLIRVQVKTTREPKAVPQRKEYTPAYLFNIRRMGRDGRKSYTSSDVDIFALVALDTNIIGYISEKRAKQTMIFRIPDYSGAYFGERNSDRNKKVIELREKGLSFTQIAKELNIDRAQAHRITSGKEGGNQRGLYLNDLSFEDAMGGL